MIKLYKSGDSMAIKTDCAEEHDLVMQFSHLIGTMIEDKQFEHDWEFQLNFWLPQFVDLCCKLRGYKNTVIEKHLLMSGEIFEGDLYSEITDRDKVIYPLPVDTKKE